MTTQSPSPSRFAAVRSPAALACFLLTAIVGVVLDLWSKVYAWHHLLISTWTDARGLHAESEVYNFIPGYLHFQVILNYGAVFGVGQGKRFLFIVVSVAAILFISYLFAVSGRQRLYQFILGMLMAGVLGNLYDRAKYGYVRDMIHGLPRWGFFPYIFNIADTLLCTGVGLMVLHSFLHGEAERKRKTAPKQG